MLRVPRLQRTLLLAAALATLAGCQTKHHLGKLPEQRPEVTAPAPRPLPQGSAEGVPEHLLHEYEGRKPQDIASDAKIRGFSLPNDAKGIVATLLTFAAKDDLARMRGLFTTHARWGIPDRREYDTRRVLEHDREFLDVLRGVASRFGRKENLNCPPIMPGATGYVRAGAEPMWCFYISNDSLDILAFKLVPEHGSAKIDYVGLYAERPTTQIRPRTGPQPPPLTPSVRRGGNLPRQQPGDAPPTGTPGEAPAGAPPSGMPPSGMAPPAGPSGMAPPAGTPLPVGTAPAAPTGSPPPPPSGKPPTPTKKTPPDPAKAASPADARPAPAQPGN
jgi:hypothetical protein